MILHRHCPLCKSSDLSGFALDTQRKGPHISRVKCETCGLVFANPMADALELADYYTNYYDKEHFEAFGYERLILDHFQRIACLKEPEIKREMRFLNNLVGGVNFWTSDVGWGWVLLTPINWVVSCTRRNLTREHLILYRLILM